jgi:hypothetical protein
VGCHPCIHNLQALDLGVLLHLPNKLVQELAWQRPCIGRAIMGYQMATWHNSHNCNQWCLLLDLVELHLGHTLLLSHLQLQVFLLPVFHLQLHQYL